MPALYLIAAIAVLMSTQIAVDLTPRRDLVYAAPHATQGLKVPVKAKVHVHPVARPLVTYSGNWVNAGRH